VHVAPIKTIIIIRLESVVWHMNGKLHACPRI